MTFKDILTNLDDQVLKGLVLKVKNECMKKDIQWSEVRVFLKNLKDYDEQIFLAVLNLVIEKKYK
ncbi:hypothetical protein CL650_000385 [bacterium]|jgi:hypothetical protein|nr:hypothetical protein [bacterium]RZP16116.1 MAG: hypothetical protein EVA30_00100 [Candidatus Dadabacteria bacterium]|tara:strand:+ start:920 stop:1114 length:195 start_codon:yes stop_codon:yes gene_type:complete